MKTTLITALALTILAASSAEAARLKDLASVEGVRSHSLVGYGIVVGLQGTGDDRRVASTNQSIASMLRRMGVVVPPGALDLRNAAGVMVTADLPAFARVGQKIDVTVSSIGNARSLAGGVLILTPLNAPDGAVYASAQGQLTVGGFTASAHGTSVTKNQTAVATIPSGGSIERAVAGMNAEQESVRFVLARPDFTTAQRVAAAIDQTAGSDIAEARDATSIEVKVPAAMKGKLPELMATLEAIEVEPDGRARVVVNERTGTVVLGRDVRIGPVAVAHGNLTIEVETTTGVSQPSPFSQGGKTEVVPEAKVQITEDKGPIKVLGEGGSLEDVVAALNALGVTPRDLIAILQAIRAAGALDAELEVR